MENDLYFSMALALPVNDLPRKCGVTEAEFGELLVCFLLHSHNSTFCDYLKFDFYMGACESLPFLSNFFLT